MGGGATMKKPALAGCFSCSYHDYRFYDDEEDELNVELRRFEKLVTENQHRLRPPVHRRIYSKLLRSFRKKRNKQRSNWCSLSEQSMIFDTTTKSSRKAMTDIEDNDISASSSLFSSRSSSNSSSFSSPHSPFSAPPSTTSSPVSKQQMTTKPMKKQPLTRTATTDQLIKSPMNQNYGSNKGLVAIALGLLLLVLFGKVCAIICTSSLLCFFAPRNCGSSVAPAVVVAEDDDEEEKRGVEVGHEMKSEKSVRKVGSSSFWRSSFKVKKST